MELLNIDCLGQSLRLEASMAGWQVLYWGGQAVAGKNADGNAEGDFSLSFELTDSRNGEVIPCELSFKLGWQPFQFDYQLKIAGEVLTDGERTVKDIERQTPVVEPKVPR
ncbi:site-2 protease family protein, partial [Oceanospirillum sp. HFRX-1_2]